MESGFSTHFFFGSRALLSTDYVTIELKHIYRQNDRVFIDLLNKVRNNQVDSDVLSELNKRYNPDFDPDSDGGYITLTTHNYQAQLLNDSKLEKLPGSPHSFKATVKDEFPEFSYPTFNELILKKDAQVLFVKNDISRDKLFDAESNVLLQERVKKAGEFFSVKLEAALKGIPSRFSVETDNKTVRKSVSEALERIRKEGVIKLACLNAVRPGFTVSKYLDAKAKSSVEIPEVKSHSAKSVEDNSGIIQHTALFSGLKEWRNEKARDMELPHYMILHQKTMVTLTNFMPRSMNALKLVKGMGKKKSEEFGEDLLNIIISYCEKEKIEPPVQTLAEKKIPKKIKEDTKKISYGLFKEGKAISQIAEERNLSINTIESHLAYYVGTGEIPVNKFVSQEKAELIAGHFDGNGELKMGPVKVTLGDKVSWSEIKFVANHLMFLRTSKGDIQ
jgi:hypothetical protein